MDTTNLATTREDEEDAERGAEDEALRRADLEARARRAQVIRVALAECAEGGYVSDAGEAILEALEQHDAERRDPFRQEAIQAAHGAERRVRDSLLAAEALGARRVPLRQDDVRALLAFVPPF